VKILATKNKDITIHFSVTTDMIMVI